MQKQFLFFKLLLCFVFISVISANSLAQTGLNFQGVARGSNNVILASQQISLRLSILQGSATGSVEYTETRKVTTNAQGLFAVVIGDADAINTLGNFNTINWKNTPKFLKIEMDAAAGNNFITIGTTQFQYVAYAQYAKTVDAENMLGVLPISKGGTGLSSIAALKSALSIDKINNTADADKPISTKTQAALDLISTTLTDTISLSNRINLKANASDVNIITTTLGAKLNAADTIKYTKQAYSDSSLLSKLKITDTSSMLSSRISRDTLNLSKRINLKANSTDLTLGLELKENSSNKSTASDLGGLSPSDVLFPTQKAVKDYVTANAGSGGVADGGITNLKLADGAVTYAKFQNIPTNSILGNTSSSTTSVQAIATTGSDNVVLSNSPTINSPILITPNLGAATASSINNVTINGFNFKSDVPSLTITGTTTLIGNNSGDNAINTRYESLATNGVVDIVSAQNIIGEKSFSGNLYMSNLIGAGTNSPTTINFANGSKIGDIQNINVGNPNAAGSIDLFAPDGAKWVQMNYGNANYLWIDQSSAGIDIGNNYWKFNNDGSTELPGGLYFKDDYDDEIKSDYEIAITSKGYLRLRFDDSVSYTRLGIYKDEAELYITNNDFDNSWNYKVDGSSWFPGDLNFTNNHAINFINSGTSSPTTDASIESNGPQLRIKSRDIIQGIEDDVDYGIQINFADKSIIELKDDFIYNGIIDTVNQRFSNYFFSQNGLSLDFVDEVQNYHNIWNFNGEDGKTTLPGDLNFTDNHAINFISSGTSTPTTSIYASGPYLQLKTRAATTQEIIDEEINWGLVLKYGDINSLHLDQDQVTLGMSNNDANLPESFLQLNKNTIFFNLAHDSNSQKNWIFNGEDGTTTLPGDLTVNGNLSFNPKSIGIGNINFSNLAGHTGDVLTLNAADSSVYWSQKNNIGTISSINGISSGTQTLTVEISNTDTAPSFNSDSITSIHSLSLPMASANSVTAGLLSKADYDVFNAKQAALINPVTGIGTSGQLSFFVGSNSISGDSKFVWDGSKNSLSVGEIPTTSIEKFELISGAPNKNSILIASPNGDGAGSQIGFISKSGSNTNTGLFQLDGEGNMVFRTMQGVLSFDNFGETDIDFRVGKRDYSLNQFVYTTPMKIKADQSVNFYSNVNISSGTLSVTGDVFVTGNVTASSFPISSDYRLKQNITPLQNSLSIIEKLNPVAYDKKQNLASEDYSIKENGFIAQELQKILPDLVHESTDKDKLLSVNYTAIIPILTKGIQEQQAIIEDQKKRLEALEKLVSDLINKK